MTDGDGVQGSDRRDGLGARGRGCVIGVAGAVMAVVVVIDSLRAAPAAKGRQRFSLGDQTAEVLLLLLLPLFLQRPPAWPARSSPATPTSSSPPRPAESCSNARGGGVGDGPGPGAVSARGRREFADAARLRPFSRVCNLLLCWINTCRAILSLLARVCPVSAARPDTGRVGVLLLV